VKIRICASIAASKISEVSHLVRKAESLGADLAEVRLDYLENLEGIEKVVKEATIPLIATNRRFDQGGKRPQKEGERIKRLLEAAKHGFSYVDIELTTPEVKFVTEELKKNNIKTIVSFHDFKGTPETKELRKILTSEIKASADICKLVTTANSLSDNIPCLSLLSKTSEKTKIVCFAMGKEGILSRVFSPLFGAHFTYAALQSGMETAPGQLSIQSLREVYRHLGVEK